MSMLSPITHQGKKIFTAVILLSLFIDPSAIEAFTKSLSSKNGHMNTEISLVELPASTTPPLPIDPIISHEIKVSHGDLMADLLHNQGLSNQEIYQLTKSKFGKKLSRIYQNDRLVLKKENHKITQIDFYPSSQYFYRFTATGRSFTSKKVLLGIEPEIQIHTFTIKNSLFNSATLSGLPEKLTIQIAHIFAWDIDFPIDVRSGDRVTILYEQFYANGEWVGNGDIVGAEFINHGKQYRAIRYINKYGQKKYYDTNGKNLQKAFLRTPMNVFQISSHFNKKRKHPILNHVRAHEGTDYAAPKNSIVKSSGDGVIAFVGRHGGYGKLIKIKHGHKYETRYAHLNKFAKGIRVGRRIKQGQTIGYVGKTGMATGYHLHYEFLINGQARNPVKVRLPNSTPLNKYEKRRFLQQTQPLIALLETAFNYFAINTN